MKKIVALALSLVMVLGLATTAFAATADKSYGGLYSKTTDVAAATDTDVTVEYYGANAVKYEKDGKTLKTPGNVAYYMVDGLYYVKVDAVKDADLVIYKDAAMKNVFMYLDEIVDPTYIGTGKAFTNFGEKCGQYAYEPEKTDKFYSCGDAFYFGVKAVEAEDNLMVDGKLVPVVDVTAEMEALFVGHVAAYTIEDGKTVAVECSECGKAAVYVANWMSVPEGAEYVADTEGYWYWTVAAAGSAAGETVESAKTFDAGVAMYVGMSVMAAAGSAVVLKKKD